MAWLGLFFVSSFPSLIVLQYSCFSHIFFSMLFYGPLKHLLNVRFSKYLVIYHRIIGKKIRMRQTHFFLTGGCHMAGEDSIGRIETVL